MNGETTSIQVGVNVSQDSQQKRSNQTGDTESRGKESEEIGAERDTVGRILSLTSLTFQKLSKNVSCQLLINFQIFLQLKTLI